MDSRITRRSVLGTAATALSATALAVGAASEGQESDAPPDYGGWLDNVGNYDGTTADRTGQSTVTVMVGAEGNGGSLAFDPPAVHVDNGATVRWEWTGEGGSHTVTSPDSAPLDSGDAIAEAGVHYEYTFGSDGIYRYRCQPHEGLGMKGAVVVGDDYPTQAATTPEPASTPEPTDTPEPTTTPEPTQTDGSGDEEVTETPQSTDTEESTGADGSGFTAVTAALGLLGAAGWQRLRRRSGQ